MAPSFNFNTLFRESKGNDRMNNILGKEGQKKLSSFFFVFVVLNLNLKLLFSDNVKKVVLLLSLKYIRLQFKKTCFVKMLLNYRLFF